MLITATITFFILMLSIVTAIAYRMWDREGLPAPSGETAEPSPRPAGAPSRGVAADPLGRLIDIGRAMPASDESRSATRRNLISAGFRDEAAVSIFYGVKAVLLVLFPIASLVLLFSMNPDIFAILPAVALSVYVAMRIPEWYLRRRLTKRKQQVKGGLPDFLDLLVISVESGFSLEQALVQTAHDLQQAHPVFHDEISVFQGEIQAGATRAEALRNLAQRTGEPEMRRLTSVLIQADRFGSSISKVLRSQARYMRIRRRQKAEELAHKVGVKLVFPIFFFIMPSMFLVTAGPAVIMLMGGIGGSPLGE